MMHDDETQSKGRCLIPRRETQVIALAFVCGCLVASLTGCQGFGRRANQDSISESNPWLASKPKSDVTLAGGEQPDVEQQDATTRLVNFVTGKSSDPIKGKELYQQGDVIFRDAIPKARTEAVDEFYDAAKLFRKAGKAAPGSALEQDALFMQAESLFFADRLTEATKVYEKLQKDYPRNRHNDRVAARLFSISRYWIDAARAGDDNWFKLNLVDSKRPTYDAKGHAIRVLDQIRYDDPTGRLADDATMAAAAEYIRQQDFEKADEFLTDLRETFTDSDHMFLAHLLGMRCKLEVYAGPHYSGLILEEAEDLVNKTRIRFPDKMRDRKYSEMVARAAAEIAFHQAERLATRAQFNENKKQYGAARENHRRLLAKYPDTPQAKNSRQRLAEIEKLPAVPEQRLAWLTKVFPDSRKKSDPLETVETKSPQPKPDNGTIFR